MKFLSKVVWSEGMYLAPQHFQAQNRYFEDAVNFALVSLWYEPFGFVNYALDQDALRNGTVSLLQAQGIFPDGLPFDMPECDPLPERRAIQESFPPASDRLTISLALPQRRADGRNCALDGEGAEADARYLGVVANACDENTGRDEKPVCLGRKHTRLCLENEDLEGLVRLPLARVMRDGAGHFIFDPTFIPPLLRISASEPMMAMLRRLIEILEEKAGVLSRAGQGGGKFRAGISRQDVAAFWFLHTIQSSLSSLRHLYLAKRGHPEELFREFSRLAGALCTFGLEVHPQSLPAYDHNHLDVCFQALNDHIRRHLEIIVPASTVRVALPEVAPYFFEADISDARLLDRAQWVLSVRSSAGEADLIQKVPQLVKMCSAKFAPELVKRAVPGLKLTHLPVPPSAISAQVDAQYFAVNRSGPCWEHIVMTRRVGVYVPGEIAVPEVELLVILET